MCFKFSVFYWVDLYVYIWMIDCAFCVTPLKMDKNLLL